MKWITLICVINCLQYSGRFYLNDRTRSYRVNIITTLIHFLKDLYATKNLMPRIHRNLQIVLIMWGLNRVFISFVFLKECVTIKLTMYIQYNTINLFKIHINYDTNDDLFLFV